MQAVDTGRLILRPFKEDDLDAFYRLGTVAEAIRYVGNTPFGSPEQALQAMRDGPLADYERHGFGRVACVWKDSGEVIGFSGLKYMAAVDAVELGYRFLPEYWGLGLATESGRACLRLARDVYALDRLVGLVHPDNAGSARVLSKLGFAVEGRVSLDFIPDTPVDLFARRLLSDEVF
ncbi:MULTISPECIES: GNAT family N-acetyltransferase [Chromobacterium]|uniref:GNAT family N-acetyltransferase n=2 Tax=Chromobacterium TaxID=535 RepID=A0ABS3GSL9_9NEIS|nr:MULTISPECIES: GNAT family N-acetyltransferase [Chromobacterium]AXT47524.1 N-acetyltransferase [Chromobacterium rhizoryzae]MBK0416704.1 GNAT family N-acetyltransferase [Chromobacterium haemolyticum]MBO0417954.1 GNAT family N-acetyltransferase [Chromobacterium haemolyticum]MBO0501091.1 GNAT family N-acetyltransferase [Chromobacterium haemolyticum]MDH0344146.1 GNAT family N-acetyltransferase [Chromobacterium haemolyticum]